ncbi:MAG: mechanosensitive ion channel family protein [Tannerella sp.]|jgi:MscS family membrane protein|nr:mechanosensitive ion channel family protein [Tannerella sp.]
MLENMYYGNSVQDWGISILIIAGGIMLNQIILILNRRVIQRITKKSKILYDALFFIALEKPVMLGVMLVVIRVAVDRLSLSAGLHDLIAQSYRVLIVLNITWFIARFVIAVAEEHCSHQKTSRKGKVYFDHQLFPMIKRGLLVFIWLIGGVTALSEVGIKVTTLLGTLGIGGIALALAAQDTVKNILGGITIFVDRTFRIGDIITVETTEGVVEDIGLRSTRIRTYDKRIVIIPNYKLMDASITNISSEPARRVVVNLGLTYDTRPDQMQQALDLLKHIPQTVSDINDKDLVATFSEFGESALIITFVYFIRKQADIRETISKVNFEILRTFSDAGLNFAFPSQTIYLDQ